MKRLYGANNICGPVSVLHWLHQVPNIQYWTSSCSIAIKPNTILIQYVYAIFNVFNVEKKKTPGMSWKFVQGVIGFTLWQLGEAQSRPVWPRALEQAVWKMNEWIIKNNYSSMSTSSAIGQFPSPVKTEKKKILRMSDEEISDDDLVSLSNIMRSRVQPKLCNHHPLVLWSHTTTAC